MKVPSIKNFTENALVSKLLGKSKATKESRAEIYVLNRDFATKKALPKTLEADTVTLNKPSNKLSASYCDWTDENVVWGITC